MSLETLNRAAERATAKEIDFLIYIMRFQDGMGVIRGITMAETCEALGIHKSKFYAIILSLEEKEIIRVYWSEKRHGFWTILIIDNSFVCKEDYKKGYINLNTKFLLTDEFISLTKSEKVICLKILALYREQRKNIVLRLKTLMDWTGMSFQSVRKYVLSIRAVFKSASVNNGVMTIDLSVCFNAFSRNFKSESDVQQEHLLNYILSIKKVKNRCASDIKDTLAVFKIFGAKFGTNAVITAVIKCIESYGSLIPKYINKMTHIIGENKNLIELLY